MTRIGIDLGGTKIAGIVLGDDSRVVAEERAPAPQSDYAATLAAIAAMVTRLDHLVPGAPVASAASVGIGMPGAIAPATGLVQNANSTWLNGRPLKADLETRLARPVRLANDANCFALSETVDGAGQGARAVFGVILGTGCGGGLVHGGRLIDGPRAIGGEWGHNPLPWATDSEHPGPLCWCGRRGCMETWVSGPALARDHVTVPGSPIGAPLDAPVNAPLNAEAIAAAAQAGDAEAAATLARHASRLARGLAHVVNIFDPDVIVLGGGLSQLAHLYRDLPGLMGPHIFAAAGNVDIRPPRWGDASGVRGAARLWE